MKHVALGLFLVVWSIPLALGSMACGGSNPEPQHPVGGGGGGGGGGTGTTPVGPGTVMPPASTTAPMGTLGPLPTGLPTALPPFGGGGGGAVGGTATPLDPNLAQAATGPLSLLARTEAPSAAPAGAPLVGNFQEGQTLEQAITISPGKCYTFVAAGVGPQELEISLVGATAIPGFQPAMGSSKGTGLRTVLGAKDACIKLALVPVDVPAKWIVKSTKGGGVVAAQAFVK